MNLSMISLVREALALVLLVSAPPLAAALATGTIVGVLQAATQVQEPSLGVAPRLVAVLAALAASGPWIGAQVVRFAQACLDLVPRVAP